MNNLAEMMKRRCITAVELAKITKLSPTTIRRMMKDTNVTPFNKTAIKLSEALGYSIAQIRGEKEI